MALPRETGMQPQVGLALVLVSLKVQYRPPVITGGSLVCAGTLIAGVLCPVLLLVSMVTVGCLAACGCICPTRVPLPSALVGTLSSFLHFLCLFCLRIGLDGAGSSLVVCGTYGSMQLV